MKIASPMYILRDRAREDLIGTISSLEGFDGVEFLGFFGNPAREVKKALDGAGLSAASDHVPYGEFLRDTQRVLDYHEEIGCRNIVLSELPYADAAACRKIVRSAAPAAHERGIRLHYHNHAGELEKAEGGGTALDALLAAIPESDMSFECDAGWISIAGADPGEYLERYADRIAIVHLKDWSPLPDGGYLFRPTGYGVMGYPLLMPRLLACKTEWAVADHDDSYGRDPVEELKMSLAYMRGLYALYGA